MSSVKLINAHVVDPVNRVDFMGGLLIEGSTVAAVAPKLEQQADRVIDCQGAYVLPGLVDMHVHLRDPGQTYKEDVYSASRAAAAGGVTALVAMPNTDPAIDSPEILRAILEKAHNACCRVYQAAAITKGLRGNELVDFSTLAAAGAAAFSDDGRPVGDSRKMALAMKAAAQLGVPVLAHSEDLDLAADGVMHLGEVSKELGVPGVPAAAENCGTARDIALCESLNLPVHICHVSTKVNFAAIRSAKQRGARLTCETAPHYLLLDHTTLRARNADFRMNPPLRTREDVNAAIRAVQDGTVDVIATDHAPHTPAEKADFLRAPNGAIGMETSLSACYTALVQTGVISFARLVELMSVRPAQIMGIPGGNLSPGKPADLTVFDPREQWTVDKHQLHGKSQNCPFDGMQLYGRVKLTALNGEIVYQI